MGIKVKNYFDLLGFSATMQTTITYHINPGYRNYFAIADHTDNPILLSSIHRRYFSRGKLDRKLCGTSNIIRAVSMLADKNTLPIFIRGGLCHPEVTNADIATFSCLTLAKQLMFNILKKDIIDKFLCVNSILKNLDVTLSIFKLQEQL